MMHVVHSFGFFTVLIGPEWLILSMSWCLARGRTVGHIGLNLTELDDLCSECYTTVSHRRGWFRRINYEYTQYSANLEGLRELPCPTTVLWLSQQQAVELVSEGINFIRPASDLLYKLQKGLHLCYATLAFVRSHFLIRHFRILLELDCKTTGH